jgi:hypothetical protein
MNVDTVDVLSSCTMLLPSVVTDNVLAHKGKYDQMDALV